MLPILPKVNSTVLVRMLLKLSIGTELLLDVLWQDYGHVSPLMPVKGRVL